MLSQIAKEVVESSHISSSGEQYPGNVLEHMETQRFLDYILTASRRTFLDTQLNAMTIFLNLPSNHRPLVIDG